MKKRTSFLIFLITILTIAFSSCKLKVEAEDLYDKPGVNVTDNQVTIIIPKISNDTKYVNIYRRDLQKDDEVNIGILYHPLALENDNKNYCYIDTLIKKEHSYEYKVRYYDGSNYNYSEWSDTIYIESTFKAYPESQNLVYDANGSSLVYERTDYTLTFSGTIIPPDFPEFSTEGYKPMLIIQSEDSTQAFEISSVTSGNTPISLRGMLPSEFLDTNITILGIVAQKTIYDDPSKPDDEKQMKTVIWTEPTEIPVNGTGSSNSIFIPAQTGTAGLDYSRKVK